ncbi:dynamin family protein [Oscillatoria sp. FACHB-1407]|uniref:dynamin family protein n=1 Tax=Oscillatoria sp. FACHB-1407 TaxID=2692847 RepID=UPI001687FF17|nr:dynamin family protein [Oscillatoria sp. FACHB-1407]MBD2465969.1 dynamin family protein [Oscillatoria sp. FACHB-1407]
MTSTALKPDIQGLQKDVVDLLEQVSQLMGRASTQLWPKDGIENKYIKYQQQILDEVQKVKNLELRMAIAAPMKAGKSTIINAIIGQELLPSRNSAMTTLPTEIVFRKDLEEPVLTLSFGTLSVFHEAWLTLKRRVNELEKEGLQAKMGEYPHLMQLIQQVQDAIGFSIRARTTGHQKIIETLAGLNDIIRLCSQLAPLADPLRALDDVPRIETPFWRLQVDAPIEALGNLVIVDTPGPNEAGENLRLVGVVEEQLQKSSLVLIVLDYTQLKTKAAEEVKEDVQKVIKIRGKDNLYILVNKVDQRTDNDMTPEQVQQFVSAEFGLDADAIKNRVFEISARRAFYATNFQLELQQYSSNIEIAQMATAKALAQQAFGDMWEIFFTTANMEQMQLAFEQVWQKSGFAPFLNNAIAALMAEAAPRCMRDALRVTRTRLLELQDAMKLRRSAITQDTKQLESEVIRLQQDLEALGGCQLDLRGEVESKKNALSQRLRVILNNFKFESEQVLQEYFLQGLSQRSTGLDKVDLDMRKLLLKQIDAPIVDEIINKIIPNSLSSLLKYKVALRGRNEISFTSKQEAEEFAGLVFSEAKQIIERLLDKYFSEIQEQINDVQANLKQALREQTRGVVERARHRLNQTFHVDLSLPDIIIPDGTNVNVGSVNIGVLKREKNFFESIVDWFQSLLGKSTSNDELFTVSLEQAVKQINHAIEKKIENTNEVINAYLDSDFQRTMDRFFEELDIYLHNYQSSLRQALQDQKTSLENQALLRQTLKDFTQETEMLIDSLNTKRKRIKDLTPQ